MKSPLKKSAYIFLCCWGVTIVFGMFMVIIAGVALTGVR